MEIKIFWCRFNKYYAQKWASFLNNQDWILIASCAVTDNAKKKFIKEVKQQIKKWKKVYLTWCWAFYKDWEIKPDWFYLAYPSLYDYKNNIVLLPENPPTNTANTLNKWIYTKGFVIVQLGCDSHCTFCITVKKRGAHKNKDIKEVIDEINNLYKNWTKEVVLTWINLAAWWLKTTNEYPNKIFPKLLQQILENTEIPRIRISSLWPEFIDESWYSILENNRILPYFHLSIQSGSNKILKSMWRHYTIEHVKEIIKNLKKLNKSVPVNIWADIIVWFPGETEKDFELTKEICYEISKLHVFPFSAHHIWDTVPASKFPNQVDYQTKKKREEELIKICNKNYENLNLSTKWKKVKVLIEDNNTWWTENYLKYISQTPKEKGKIYEIIWN